MKFIIKLGGPVVKNLPTNAGHMDLISDPEVIAHASEQLNP